MGPTRLDLNQRTEDSGVAFAIDPDLGVTLTLSPP